MRTPPRTFYYCVPWCANTVAGLFRRARNSYQVTLRGIPLYTFAGDSHRGDVNGEGIRSFGGTWHTVPASTRASTPTPTPAPTPSPY